jgi:hypothetical protein
VPPAPSDKGAGITCNDVAAGRRLAQANPGGHFITALSLGGNLGRLRAVERCDNIPRAAACAGEPMSR